MKLNRVDLNLLVALDVLLAERNVTRAAERLSVGQPAMSAALGRLRRIFDDPLLIRNGTQLLPTPLAETLVQPVREALALIEGALSVRRAFDPAEDTRSFSIVASDYVTLVLLRPLIARLDREAPNVRINVHPITPQFLDQLRRGQVDMLVMPTEFAGDVRGLPSSVLFTERFLCAVAADHSTVTDRITLEQFRILPYLALTVGTLAAPAEVQLDTLGIPRNVEVTTQSFVTAPFLLAGTRLVCLVHERLGRQLAPLTGIRLLPPPMPLKPINEALIWNPRHTDDPAHRWLRSRIAALAAEI